MDVENNITREKRRKIFSFFMEGAINLYFTEGHGFYWEGFLNEVSFLYPIFDLEEMPSFDKRFGNAYEDIRNHGRSKFNDYDDPYWMFYDTRFNLKGCEDELFLKFLCRTLHHQCGRENETIEIMLTFFNKILSSCDYKIIESDTNGIYTFENLLAIEPEIEELSKEETLYKNVGKMKENIELDPMQSIGMAKEFVESACKDILTRYVDNKEEDGKNFTEENIDKFEFRKLIKETLKVLELVPEGIKQESKTSDFIKGIMSSLSSMVINISNLRNIHGVGHGKNYNYKGLEARHARLSVNSAIIFVEFILSREKNMSIKNQNEKQ